MNSGARFSRCRRFRYLLWREWAPERPSVMMIGLNPSTADAQRDDPTIRRCIGFARDWGFGAVKMLNLFAFRATYPRDLKAAADPVGPRNDRWLKSVARDSARVVACWGNDGRFMDRSRHVRSLLGNRLEVIRLNASGEPAHPLYLPRELRPGPWRR
ncbi:DUF1643 domain-containing protein [Halomonas denitrificans]|nr:DUF1643 domain-containing protein [Halomonas denitrificans]